MTMHSDDGEILEFVGAKDTHVRGELITDGMSRWFIGICDEISSETLQSIMPDEVKHTNLNSEEIGRQEYVFTVKTTVYRPTGEFRDSDPHPEEVDHERSEG